MMYRVIYDDQYFRTIPACMIDARVGTPLANATGAMMEEFIQPKVALIVPGVLPYKLESPNGNLAGVFALQTSSTGAVLLFSIIRPAFVEDQVNISQEIVNFIQGQDWVYDK